MLASTVSLVRPGSGRRQGIHPVPYFDKDHRPAFVLTLGNKEWFGRSRYVGCYSGFGHDGASPANVTRSSASPRPEADTCDIF